ncbi:MAG: NADP-dependent malic enzyme [Candidatus Gracilibacteria bacterium]
MTEKYKNALELHEKHHGKMEVKSKVPVSTRGDLALAYTPGVADVCRVIAEDASLAKKYTLKSNTIAVVSDGSAVLGLGNIGAEGAIPVMEGKAILFKEFANVDAFPICLRTQDIEEIIAIVKNIAPVFGGINLEDIAAPKCFEIEKRLRAELDIPVFHDDQHGTAVVVLAALINALKVAGKNKETVHIVINGAGAAGTAVTELLLKYGFENITVCDSQGAIYKDRKNITEEKLDLAQKTNKDQKSGTLADVIVGRDIFIGVSKGNTLTKDMVKSMNKDPIVFALANPTPEIMPQDAKEAGAFIVATGRSDFPNQINNVFVFPGIFRGALDNNTVQITDEMLVKAAENLANHVQNIHQENILPDLFDKTVAEVVAKAIQ